MNEKSVPGLHEWLLLKLAPWLKNVATAIDLGCGDGRWLRMLHAAGVANLVGIDRDAASFTATDVARFIEADLDDDPLPEIQADLVTAIEVFEHVQNPARLLGFAAACLAPAGHMVVTTPNIYSLRARLRFLLNPHLMYFDRDCNSEHIHPFATGAVNRVVLGPLGLKVVEQKTFPERGSAQVTRMLPRLIVKTLSLALPNPLPGDSLCLFIEREQLD